MLATRMLSRIACDAVLAAHSSAAGTTPLPRDGERRLEDSYLVVRQGAHGGIVAFAPTRTILLGRDWNRDTYRVVVDEYVDDGHGPRRIRALDLSSQKYSSILDVVSRAVARLPSDPYSTSEGDAYGIAAEILLHYRGVNWENDVPKGCVQGRSKVEPSADEAKSFADMIDFVSNSVAVLPLAEGCLLDAFSVAHVQDPSFLAAIAVARTRARSEPFAPDLDLNRACVSPSSETWNVCFPWRWDQPSRFERATYGMCERSFEGYSVDVGRTGEIVRTSGQLPDGVEQDRRRRERYAESCFDCPGRLVRMVRAGWVETGMTRDMVVASWGDPAHANGNEWRYERGNKSFTLQFDSERLVSTQ